MQGLSVRRIPPDLPGAGIAIARLHYSADPEMTPERVAEMRKKYSNNLRWEREMEIAYEALEGQLYYPEFNEQTNVIEPFDCLDRNQWTIYQACDPHGRTPHGFAWEAFGGDGDRVVCGELWPEKQFTVREYSEVINWLEGDSEEKPRSWSWANGKKLNVVDRIMDTHGSAVNSEEGEDFFESYRKYGINYRPAVKGSAALDKARDNIGELMVCQPYLSGDKTLMLPRFAVFRTCRELISEYQNVRYPEGDVERSAQERPMTYRKHVMDAVMYLETAKVGYLNPAPFRSTFKPIHPRIGY